MKIIKSNISIYYKPTIYRLLILKYLKLNKMNLLILLRDYKLTDFRSYY
jgi:hypothetical protein